MLQLFFLVIKSHSDSAYCFNFKFCLFSLDCQQIDKKQADNDFNYIFLVLSATLSDGQHNSNEGSDISSTLTTSTTLSSAVETTSTIDEDYDSEKSSTSETQDTKQPPLVFPNDDEKTETSKNETALEILQKNSSNASTMESQVNTEVKLIK